MYARARILITFFVFIFLLAPSLSHATASVISQYTGIAEPYASYYNFTFDIAEPSTFIATGTLTTLSLPVAGFKNLLGDELFSIQLFNSSGDPVDCQTPEKTTDAWGITRIAKYELAPSVTFGPFTGTQCAIERNDSGSQSRTPVVMKSGAPYGDLGVMGTGFHFNFTAYGPDVPDPPLCTLTASPTAVTLGDSSTLSWTTTNATAFTLDNSIGAVTPVAGSSTSVSATTTTTYTGTATGAGGSIACSATLTINPKPPPPATTSSSPGAISIPYIPPPVAPVVEAPAQAPVATVVSQPVATPTVPKAVPKIAVAKKKKVVKPVVVPTPIVEETVEAPVAIVVEQPKRVIPPIPQTASVYDAVSVSQPFSEELINQIHNVLYVAIFLSVVTGLISLFRHRSRLKNYNE